MNSRRCMTDPKLRRRHLSDQNEYFGRGRSGIESIAMSAANVSMPAAAFRGLGGFDEAFTIASSEDWDLGFRARGADVAQ